jgi:hypothetical protein
MDSGIIVQLFLGVLWALGCALFVTFLLEFSEDRSAHSSYPDRMHAAKPSSAKPASKTGTREIGSVTIAAENSANPSNGNSSASARPLYAKAKRGNAG